MKINRHIIQAFGVILASNSCIYATGIEQAYHDPTAAARGNAFSATADTPSAVHYNPAGLVWQEAPAIQGFSMFSRTNIRHDNISGGNQDAYQTILTGAFFANYPGLANDRLALGLGVIIPHGMGIEWSDNSLLRSIAQEATLTHMIISPTLSYRVNDCLSVGLSLNYAYDDLELTRGLFIPGDSFTFKGTGDGWGASLGVLWKPTDQWSVGMTYRSSIETHISGSATTETLVPVVSQSTVSGKTEFDYPQQIVAGVAYTPNDRWLFELNVQWTEWSAYKDFRLELPTGDLISPNNYDDTFLVGFGARYRLSDQIDLNFGYLYSQAAVSDSSYNAFVPDAPLHILSVGVDSYINNWKLSAAVLYGHREERKVSGSPISPTSMLSSDGTWKADGVSLLFGATLSF